MPDTIVVLGSGGHAKVVIDAVLARTPAREIIVLDDSAASFGKTILGIEVSGTWNDCSRFRSAGFVPAVGDNRARAELVDWLDQNGLRLETVIHPAACVAGSAVIGPGCFISAGAIVMAEARIGAGAILNTAATVDHDCTIGEAAHIAPGVHSCGNVRVGARTLVGVGSSIRPGIEVCDDVVLGAGSVVVRSISVPGTYAGNPARRIG